MNSSMAVRSCRSAAAATLIVAACLATAGCGSSSESGETDTQSPAASLFQSAGCAGCHTLAAADASGPVGPVLDGQDLSKSEVESQIRNGGGTMPSFDGRLSDKEIEELSVFVSSASR